MTWLSSYTIHLLDSRHPRVCSCSMDRVKVQMKMLTTAFVSKALKMMDELPG